MPDDWRRPSKRQRALGLGLTLAAELLFLLMLLGLVPSPIGGERDNGRPLAVDFVPLPQVAPAAERKAAGKAAPAAPRPRLSTPPPNPLAKSPFLELSRAEMAAADISKLGTAGGRVAVAAADNGALLSETGGPGGARLYRAEWLVEPSDAELAYYVPGTFRSPGWARIACKTIPNNRVENCVQEGESPLGSGLARGMRLAAWQFKVRPPRIDGKPMIGVWVRIHIEFTSSRD